MDGVELHQYPDSVIRESYPALPRHGGNSNAVASEAMLSTILARLPQRLELPVGLPTSPVPLPDDPEVAAMHAAGWL